MALDPLHADRLHLLEGVRSFSEAVGDPAVFARVQSFFADDDGYTAPAVRCREDTVPSRGGDVRVRVYEPDGEVRGALVWAHGGGFTHGDIDMRESDTVARELCDRGSIAVVSVDYALSGNGMGYPTPHWQVSGTFDWARERVAAWGIAEDRVALGGASAGGNIAFGATAERHARGESLPERLVLAYPTVHRIARHSCRVEALTSGLPRLLRFLPEDIEGMYAAYVGDAPDASFSSVDGMSLRGFPPLVVLVDEYDDLRVSGEDLVEQARRDGVSVEFRVADGMVHGHLNRSPLIPVVDRDLEFLAELLSRPFAIG